MASKNTLSLTEGGALVEVNLNQVVFDPSDLIVDEDVGYPEGGTEAWLVVFGAWCAMVSSMGLLNTLAVLQAWVLEHDLSGMSESTVGWIFGAYGFFLYFCGAQVGEPRSSPNAVNYILLNPSEGPIFDAHDIKLLIIPGSVGMVASMIFLSLSKGMVFGLCAPPLADLSPRVLSVFLIIRRSRWYLGVPSLQS